RQLIYGGTFFKLWGAHQIYSGLKDYEKSLVNHIRLLMTGKNLFVFPEGHITRDGQLHSAHGGIAYLAERCKLLIVPIGISRAYNISIKEFFLRRRKIRINFGHPIDQAELRQEVARKIDLGQHVYKEEAEYVMEKVKELMKSP
ncbi:L-acyl-sn-glycerol-3-phosphate acetyltransferase, partial [sediment metagenome]